MRVTKAMIARAQRIQKLQSAAYQTGTMPVVVDNAELRAEYPEGIPTHTALADFPYSTLTDQTPRRLCSFTADLASLLSINPSFITGLTEEAAHYIDEYCCDEYERYLALAAKQNNLQPPEGLEAA